MKDEVSYMKIKEVEQVTGISSHNIRFYEEMGLIQVQRDPENKYREFSEEDIKLLKEIKLFRGLDITMEEIRRYYNSEITLQQLMKHQLNELKAMHQDMNLKERLCEDIKNSKLPLVSYTVEQYDQVIQHKRETTPIESAGSLISTWNQTEHSRSRMFFLECFLFPFIWLFTSFIVILLFNLNHIISTKQFNIEYSWPSILIVTIISLLICYYDYGFMVLPDELYEFRENGIYYMRKDSRKQYRKMKKLSRIGRIEDCMAFIPYEDIEILKVWFHMVAKTPINGGNAYQVDFYLISKFDEVIRINTGMLGVSDEKVKLTAEILKEHANKVVDPYHLLPALDLDREKFYNYLDRLYYKREHIRVFGKPKESDINI